MATNSYVQVPPDSSGKKMFAVQHDVSGQTVHAPVHHLSCGINPENVQYVDNRGQAFMRFAEGSPTMDAFGNLRVSDATVLGAYEYTNGDMSDLFDTEPVSGAAATYQPESSMLVLSTNSTATSSVTRTSNRYHYYQPGVGNLIIATLSLGDSGKANNVREWGYFDSENGLFFRLNGTELQVVIRTSTSGTVTESVVSQSAWNGDKLDGTGLSGVDLDVTMANFYWIDFAWLGVGSVRFGILGPDGSRWTCHTFQNPNNLPVPYMMSGSLPIAFRNYNTGVTSGASQMNLICSAVYAEAQTRYTFWRYGDCSSGNVFKTVAANTPLVSLRPALTYAGKTNRIGLYPDSISFCVLGGPVEVSIVDDAVLSGANWTSLAESAEQDNAASSITGGSIFKTFMLSPGTHTIDVSNCYETNDEGYHVLANGTEQHIFTLVATKLVADAVTMKAVVNYRELR